MDFQEKRHILIQMYKREIALCSEHLIESKMLYVFRNIIV